MPLPSELQVTCPTLIGRSAAVNVLVRALDAAKAGNGQTLIIAGEAGIGKSRLLSEAWTIAAQSETRIVRGNCFEQDRAFPYAPLLDLLRAYCTTDDTTSAIELLHPVAPRLARLSPEVAALFPELSAAPANVEPEAEKRKLFQVWMQFFTRLAAPAGTPLIIAIEDLHWSDETSLDFILHLARQIRTRAILLLLTYRSDETGVSLNRFLSALNRERFAVELTLGRLTVNETEEMIRSIFHQPQPVRAEFLGAMYELSEGNPFFVEEILKSLVTTGGIFFSHGQWDRKPLGELRIPRSVSVAVQQRLEQLGNETRRLLTLAAVAGRRFDLTLLQQVLASSDAPVAASAGGDEQILRHIKELVAAQLVVDATGNQFAFRHALTRHAIYAELLTPERRVLHRVLGEVIEHQYAASLDAHIADLAYHYSESGVWSKAVLYARRAGEQAQALFSPREAIEQFTRALAATQQLSGRESSRDIAAMCLARGQAHEFVSEFEYAEADYAQALYSAHAIQDRQFEWQALFALGYLWTGRDYGRAHEYLQRALDLARASDEPATLGATLNRLGNWYMMADRIGDSLRAHEEALAIFTASNDRRELAATLDLLAMANYFNANVPAGAGYHAQAIAMLRSTGNRQGLSEALATFAGRGGNYYAGTQVSVPCSLESCAREMQEAVQLARALGWRAGEASALIYTGLNVAYYGDYAQALASLRLGQEIAIEIEHDVWQTSAHLIGGAMYIDLLDPERSIPELAQASAFGKQSGSQFIRAQSGAFLAEAHLALDDPLAAAAVLADLPMGAEDAAWYTSTERMLRCAHAELALARRQPERALSLADGLLATAVTPPSAGVATVVIPRIELLRAKALMGLRRLAEAEHTLLAARDAAVAQGVPPLLWRIVLALAQLQQMQGRAEDAAQSLALARMIVGNLAANLSMLDEAEGSAFAQRAAALFPTERTLTALQAAKREASGLTGREREIAVLIARGLANREIAGQLMLSQRTIEAHISHIMDKLAVSSRTQIAVWASAKLLAKPPGDGSRQKPSTRRKKN